MEKILLFGGTFDPPHKGHRHLLEEALKQADFDRVLLIPAFIPPHKSHRPALSFEARAGILRDWFEDIKNLEISDIEQSRGGQSYTADTIAALKGQYPNSSLYLLIGSDMFLSFETWSRFELLLQQVTLVVGSRKNGDYEELFAHRERLLSLYKCKGILLCNMDAVECASSDLRARGDGLAERALAHISAHLDVSRARHTMQVADYAKFLAEKNGVDGERAYLAGLLHDCTKCFGHEWHIQYLEEKGIHLSLEDLASPQILHQISGAIYAREALEVEDAEILSAIACHTTGKMNMSLLDKILFFADSCEPTRDYPAVENLRRIGEENINEGVAALLERTIHYINERNQPLHPQTEEARVSILKELRENG